MANTKISALTAATTPLAGTEVLPIVQSSTTKKVAISDVTAGRDVAVKNLGVNVAQSTWSSGNAVEVYGPGNGIWSNANANARLVSNWYYNGGSKFGAAGLGAAMYMLDSNTHYWYSSTAAATNAGDPITSSNTMQLASTGNLTLLTGNLVQGTAAKGINFTANTALAGMTSQLLNWYEEGTYTPTFTNCGTVSVGTARYTRIGRLVVVNMTMTSTSITANSSRFTLPFTCGLLASGTFTRNTSEGGFVEAQTSSTACWFTTTPSSTTGTFVVTISYSV